MLLCTDAQGSFNNTEHSVHAVHLEALRRVKILWSASQFRATLHRPGTRAHAAGGRRHPQQSSSRGTFGTSTTSAQHPCEAVEGFNSAASDETSNGNWDWIGFRATGMHWFKTSKQFKEQKKSANNDDVFDDGGDIDDDHRGDTAGRSSNSCSSCSSCICSSKWAKSQRLS